MPFYIIMRRETSLYILGSGETSYPYHADRYYSRKLAVDATGPNTCVCGPYPEEQP